MKSTLYWIAACLMASASLAGAAGRASATPITAPVFYNNLPASTDGADPVSFYGPLADSFSTGGGLSNLYLLSDVKLLIGLGGNDEVAGGQIFVSLLSDNLTSPGDFLALIGSAADSSLPSNLDVVDFPTDIILSGGTRYWIEVSADSEVGSNAIWAWSTDISGTGVAGEYFANNPDDLDPVYPNVNGPYQMGLNAQDAAAPEPATVTMLGMGVASLFGYGWRKRKVAGTA